MDKKVTGKVLKIPGSSSIYGLYQSALTNIGTSDNVKIDTKVYFTSKPREIKGYPVPAIYLGQGFIYRIASNYAIVLITHIKREITDKSLVSTVYKGAT